MNRQLASDIHHYDQRLTAALTNLENDKNRLVEDSEFRELLLSKIKAIAVAAAL